MRSQLKEQAPPYAVIIVTHNSELYINSCFTALFDQSIQPKQVIIVDSGSNSITLLKDLSQSHSFILHIEKENIGFCKGNNIGMSYVDPTIRYILFLNPDAFLSKTFIEGAINHFEDPRGQSIGALSGLLLGFDINRNCSTSLIDSTGIFQSWYGRWYDRGSGEGSRSLTNKYDKPEHVPALCGAVMFCRTEALRSVELSPNTIMDPDFFMYKEDIDLSLRLRQKGWTLLYAPTLIAYHCRGWQQNRKRVPRLFRLMSARNEIIVHARSLSIYTVFSVMKYLLVKCFNR